MNTTAIITRAVALTMSMVLIVVTLTFSPAEAGLVTTERMLATQGQSEDRSKLADFITRDDVRLQMQALGIDSSEAEARIAALTDEEVRQIAGQLDQLPAGQGVFETAIVASLFAFIILLVTDILGYTDIFPFVKKTVER